MTPTAPLSEPASEVPPGYDRLLNIAGSTITVAASVLGVFGVGTGVATALLRNAPEAMLTSASVAGIAVLAGVASALVRTNTTFGQRKRQVVCALIASTAIAAVMWSLVGVTYANNGASSGSNAVLWWLFIGGIALTTALTAWRASRISNMRVRTGLALGGLFLFGSAMLAIVVLMAAALRTTARPAIATEMVPSSDPAGYVTLTAKVTAAGLSNDERYEILVHLLDEVEDPKDPPEIFHAFAGPDSDGDLSYSFKITFSPDGSRPWIGVTARLVGEHPYGHGPVNNCGVDEHGAPQRGVTCTVIRIPGPTAR